jgi:succinyl-diaminopimelate desuccinylase
MASAQLDPTGDVVALAAAICDIESVSGNEKALADAIEAALSPLSHLMVLRDADAVVASTNLGRASRVVIAGHIDTVPIANNLPSVLEGDSVSGRLVGRGTVDMKSGVAVQLKLAAELTEPNADVTWIFYDHEEVASDLNGLGRLARNHPEVMKADFAVLGEPSSAQVEGGCNGTMRVVVKVSGVKAHSARPWMGKNAIHHTAELLGRLASFLPETIEVDGLAYRESLNAVKINGGIAGNVIPDLVEVEVNYRFAPSRSEAEAEAVVRKLLEGYELEVTDSAAGARPGLNHPVAAAFVAAVGAQARPKYGWTDVARFSALGVPAVNFGPGDPNLAHADNEAVDVAEIRSCEAALRKWLTA